MAGAEESSLSEDSEGSNSSSSSEGLWQAWLEEARPRHKDPEPSASGSQPASRRKGRTWSSARLVGHPEQPSGAKACGGPSTQSSEKSRGQTKLPKPKLDLKALFDYHFRMRQRRRKRSRNRSHGNPQTEVATKPESPELPMKRPRLLVSKKEREKRYRERTLQFPFMQKVYGQKYVPLRMECLFEQATIDGFFKYIEKLKFEHHLKKSLAQLDATEDLEKESLESRRHKYLDDDGSLSPIEEPSGEDMNEDIGARIVENSCFILSSQIPEKKKLRRKTNIPFERRSSDFFLGRGLPREVVSVHHNYPWKQLMKESRLGICLLKRKEVWLKWDEKEARLNDKNWMLITTRLSTILSKETLVEQAITDGCGTVVKVSSLP